MKLADALATLKKAEASLRPRGVMHAGVFGSVARGENGPESDVDILIDLDPAAHVTIYEYVNIRETISSLFDRRADVVEREGLKPHLRQPVTDEAVYAF